MKVLVSGARRLDAGKTTVARGLVAATGAVGFKPRAGNDYWFSHTHVRKTLEAGRLYGKDARQLAAAGPDRLAPEDINPIHRLWRQTPGEGTGLLGKEDRAFIVDRVGDRFVRNGTAPAPDLVRRNLPLDDAIVVESVAEMNEAMETYHLPAQEGVRAAIKQADRAVVESYTDVARPMRDLTLDAVAVVEPSRVRLYDGERYRRACEVAPGGRATGRLEEPVPSVVDLLDPEDTIELDPLPASVREDSEAIADAYAGVYDRIVTMAAE